MLTTTQALAALASRGIVISSSTLRVHLRAGKFPGAWNTNPTSRRGGWMISEAAVEAYQPPPIGQPPKANPVRKRPTKTPRPTE